MLTRTFSADARPRRRLATVFHSHALIAFLTGSSAAAAIFSPPVHYPLPELPTSIAATEMNGDGSLDLVVGSGVGSFHILHGSSDGGFESPISYPFPSDSWRFLAARDLTADGRGDVVMMSLSHGDNAVRLYLNAESGFQEKLIELPARPPLELLRMGRPIPLVHDLNGDQLLDLVIPDFSRGGVALLFGRGQGNFSAPENVAPGAFAATSCIADFNTDGIADILFVRADHTVTLLLGKGQGGFVARELSNLSNQLVRALALAPADFDRDGDVDLAAVRQNEAHNVSVLLNDGGGGFAPAALVPTGNLPCGIVTADFNGDGVADLATANWQSSDMSVLISNGDGTFQPAVSYPTGKAIDLATGDFNRDGAVDIASLDYGQNGVSVFINKAEPFHIKPAAETVAVRRRKRLATRPGREYSIASWTTANGLPQNSVQAILQTADGFLWVGTRNGLARFDGIQFRVFDQSSHPVLVECDIRALAEGPPGTLWIGTRRGLVRFQDGKFNFFSTSTGTSETCEVEGILPRFNGRTLVSTFGGEFFFDGQGFAKVNSELQLNYPLGLVTQDRYGVLWGIAESGLVQCEPAKPAEYAYYRRPYAELIGTGTFMSLCAARNGEIWFGSFPDLFCWDNGQIEIISNENDEWWGIVGAIAEDQVGRIWFGTHNGVRLVEEDGFTAYTTREGLSHNEVSSICADREGNIWVGTTGGLNCLRPRQVVNYTTSDGLPSDDVWSVTEAPDGGLWVATSGGGALLRDADLKTFPSAAGHTGFRWIQEDSTGTVWAGGSSELMRLHDGRFEPAREPALAAFGYIPASYLDNEGTLWLAGYSFVFRRTNQTWQSISTTAWDTGAPRLVGLLRDRDGGLWIGTESSGVIHVCKYGKVERWTPSTGLTSDLAAPMLAEPDGTIWIGSDKGLNRLKDRRITRFTTAEGLREDIVLNLLEDDDGWFWLNGHRGVHRMRKSELNEFADGKRRSFETFTLSTADGLLSAEGNGGTLPNSCKSRDGRLWFPTTRGLVMVEPKRLTHSPAVVAVVIDRLRANNQLVFDLGAPLAGESNFVNGASAKRRLSLRPDSARLLQIDYTAPAFHAPDRTLFKYRLDGYDRDWHEAGSERRAVYTNLRPGEYNFRVIARGSQGAWNETGDTLAFYLAPHFYQTAWFYGGCAGALALAIAAFHSNRVRVQRRILRLELEAASLRERERIARDLHDDVGASLTRIAMLSDAARAQVNGHAAGVQIERISHISREIIDNMSELVWAANPKFDNLQSFGGYVREYAAQLLTSLDIKFVSNIDVEEKTVHVSAEVRRELFLVLKEALNNSLKHGKPARVELSMRLTGETLAIEIADNGLGFSNGGESRFGNGLANMRGRVERLNGTFTCTSQEQCGVRISIAVPLRASPVVRI